MSRIIKVILFTLIFVLQHFIVWNIVNASTSWEKYFIVTAYYSPLPNQKHYTTWSYYGDVKLNWSGHTTASGNPVFAWLLAWPKNYPYGTKIYFQWYGVWVVEDRWWAIVKAWVEWHEHDRIDIWMWYGDEGLMRAKKWWKRTIKWQVVDSSNDISLQFWKDILNWYDNIKVNPENTDKNQVILLQKLFTELWLYNWDIDWNYESIKPSLVKFQLENKIISSKYDEAAWYYWPKTIVAIIKKYWSTPLVKEEKTQELVQVNEKVKIILDYGEITLNADYPKKEDVENVQVLFKKLWLYNWEIDWNYNSIKNDIIEFQKKVWLITHSTSWWAWHIWDKTKSELILYFENEQREKALRDEKYELETHEIKELNIVSRKIENYIKTKSNWSEYKEKILKNNLIVKIDSLVSRSNDEKLKNKLMFLKENLS